MRVYYQGREFREAQVEEQAREAAERRVEQERQAKEQERQAKEQERQAKEQKRQARIAAERQVAQLLVRLKQAGLEP